MEKTIKISVAIAIISGILVLAEWVLHVSTHWLLFLGTILKIVLIVDLIFILSQMGKVRKKRNKKFDNISQLIQDSTLNTRKKERWYEKD